MSKYLWKRLIVALDLPKAKDIKRVAEKLLPKVKIFKVGLIPYTAAGPAIIRWLKERGGDILVDLKFFDIPNTMLEAAKLLIDMDVWGFTVHLRAGKDSLGWLKDELIKEKKKGGKIPLVIGVTELTSQRASLNRVMRLARTAYESKLDGVVCSVWEAKKIKKELGLLTITPGIRREKKDDQRRVATVEDALRAGVDYFVIGRPIIKDKDPLGAAKKILDISKNEQGR